VATPTLCKGINRNGFRTPEFDSLDSATHKLLLIGDSFTWGLSASPIDQCFADLIQHKVPETVINTGIPIADPAQYEAIAQQYIPQLQPQKAVLFFYLGNDIMLKERDIVPWKPFYFYTNAGALLAQDGEHRFNTAQEAYHYFTQQKFFLLHPQGLLETIIAQSALLSRLYSFTFRWQEKRNAEHAIKNMSVTQQHLHAIVSICKAQHCNLQIVLIPEVKEADEPITFFQKKYVGFFQDSVLAPITLVPSGFSKQHYVPYPDGHLNNAGHQLMAAKILELLQKNAKP
jgi:lysophospholipase L1-like esterase